MPRTNFRSPYPGRLCVKFGFDWQSGLEREDVGNCGGMTDSYCPLKILTLQFVSAISQSIIARGLEL